MRVTLTGAQVRAVEETVRAIREGANARAIRGLAGTGKSALIPELQDRLRHCGIRVAVGAPTHRAVRALRLNGVTEAKTIYSLALAPLFDDDWNEALAWFKDGGDPPTLLACFSSDELHAVADLELPEALAALGICAWEHVAGWIPRSGVADVGIIDEASMIGAGTFDLCLEAFGSVVLVGDHGQLPPINNEASILADIPGLELRSIGKRTARAFCAKQPGCAWAGCRCRMTG